jgi:hypothetical protein
MKRLVIVTDQSSSKIDFYLIDRGLVERGRRTGWQRLLELLNLLGILQHQGVQVLLASDLELDLGRLLVALDACRYKFPSVLIHAVIFPQIQSSLLRSFPSQKFPECILRAGGEKRTRSILASGNLDELRSQTFVSTSALYNGR